MVFTGQETGTDSGRIKETESRADASMGKERTAGERLTGTLLWGPRDMGRALGQHWESRKSRHCLLVESRNPGWVWRTCLQSQQPAGQRQAGICEFHGCWAPEETVERPVLLFSGLHGCTYAHTRGDNTSTHRTNRVKQSSKSSEANRLKYTHLVA